MVTTHEHEEKGFFRRREPYMFMLWLAIFGMVLLFGILALLYIGRKQAQDWVRFSVPMVFWGSTLAVLLSSWTLQMANNALSKDDFRKYRFSMGFTLGLGALFCILQIIGWQQMYQNGITLQKSIAGAFFFVISGVHLAHLLGGIYFLGMAFWESLKNYTYVDAFVYSVNPPTQLKIRLITQYWHFVDFLWLVLFILMII
jgi:cytochrome c oxidase subunit III